MNISDEEGAKALRETWHDDTTGGGWNVVWTTIWLKAKELLAISSDDQAVLDIADRFEREMYGKDPDRVPPYWNATVAEFVMKVRARRAALEPKLRYDTIPFEYSLAVHDTKTGKILTPAEIAAALNAQEKP